MTSNPLHHPECLLDLHATLGEGPIWIASEKSLYFVDIPEARIHRFTPATEVHESWSAPDRVAFLLPVEDGTFLAGMPDGLRRFDPKNGTFSDHKLVEPEKPGNRLNDGCVDPQGRLWFGTMDDGEEQPSGSIYRVVHERAALNLSHHDEGYTVSNGPAVSPCGKTLYVCDSPEQTIYAFDIQPDGELANERVFARLEQGYPDGIVTDSEGTLWCGVWGGSRVMRFRPDGTALPSIPMPVTNVTKVAFGGDDLKTVFVTTARKGLDAETLTKEPQAGSLFVFRTDVAGAPQQVFRLN
ncbi:SMP-30/gluconolactonase/LRE family protein [Gluconobacter kondonii]|uniref:SMP-30/gluconolactonase/LRE family protein n=1 Tax=Gluconobacter kondonii TaxID=941463 RepID=UPI001B8B0A1B|nr:SMP-30/gluconolactonase/LRE family protein [Gluconobacter kondonii]MBS1052199.1 SMP-30/gluconolactonase/LRE family protein [Gluconobacter kondonii]MBS1055453.1 SMP-30/gluconolactonase/LRE family protein [Gluconobacter kondonii]